MQARQLKGCSLAQVAVASCLVLLLLVLFLLVLLLLVLVVEPFSPTLSASSVHPPSQTIFHSFSTRFDCQRWWWRGNAGYPR